MPGRLVEAGRAKWLQDKTFGRKRGEPFIRITPKAASEMLADDSVQLIDVRNQDEWDAGHVPGATLIPVDDLFNRMDELDGDKKLLFICAMGVRSALACEMAAAFEYTNLYNIEGGTGAWADDGYPIE